MTIVHDRNLTLNTSATSRLRKTALLLCASLLISPLWSTQAAAQSCPAPWNNAANVYGIVLVEGTGNGSAGGYTQSVNQHAIAQGKLASFGQGVCVWEAVPGVGFGQMKSFGQEDDTVVYTPNGTTFHWQASGPGDPVWDSLTLQILPASSQYNVGAFGAVLGTFTGPAGTVNEDIIWGSQFGDGGVSQQGVAALEEQWAQAQNRNNPDLLEPLLGDKFVSTSFDGKVTGKAEALAEVKAFVKNSAANSEMKVIVYGDAAIAMGIWRAK